jgi:hypothetical protein
MTDAASFVEDLRRPWHHGEHAHATGIELTEHINLDGLTVRGFDLSGAALRGGISAKGTRFLGLAWLRGAQVAGECNFSGAHFRTDLRGDGLVAETLVLNDCVLQGCLSLTGARLNRLVIRDALVMANLTLENGQVGNIDMHNAEFMGGLWTAQASLGALEHASADISGRLRLPKSTVSKGAYRPL